MDKKKIAYWCIESQCEVPELPEQIIEGKILALREMLSFINSLPEEPVSEDLEAAAADYEEEKWKTGHPEDTYNSSDIIKAVKYGAKWQKEKMMAKAIDAQCFGFQGAALFSFRLPADKYLVGSEVKVIVINEK